MPDGCGPSGATAAAALLHGGEEVWRAEDLRADGVEALRVGDTDAAVAAFECGTIAAAASSANLAHTSSLSSQGDEGAEGNEIHRRALALAADMRIRLAPLLFTRRQWQSVVDHCSAVLAAETGSRLQKTTIAQVFYWRGAASAQLGSLSSLKSAKADLLRAVEMDPDDDLARESLSMAAECLESLRGRKGGGIRQRDVLLRRAVLAVETLRRAAMLLQPCRPGAVDLSRAPERAMFDSWVAALAAVEPVLDETGDASKEDVTDLESLSASLREDAGRAFELRFSGNEPVLVTSPHSVYLLRDDHEPHVAEEHTAEIAAVMSFHLRGASLSWTCAEQRRTALLWAVANRRGWDPRLLLDPRNRDPNYLEEGELSTSAWAADVDCVHGAWRERCGGATRALHLDVHGCRNPPDSGAHLTVGLGAMAARAEQEGSSLGVRRLAAFQRALWRELEPVVAGLELRCAGTAVLTVTGLEGARPGAAAGGARFSGAWLAAPERRTQTQQAVGKAQFSHSLQLEMSRSLRARCRRSGPAVKAICQAIQRAWRAA